MCKVQNRCMEDGTGEETGGRRRRKLWIKLELDIIEEEMGSHA